ncbi:hypothetical protein XENOCAPTIV_024107 [Xenoophorus captivus]|uniref:Phosphoprotein n=1 Tax=Xenoophorus captivus TaxID=1517983 RepID=A0ABV0QJY5_9TELE
MSVENHYFTCNASQNQSNKNTQETADATKMADLTPQDARNVMTELQGIKNILETLAVEVSGVDRGVQAVNETVKSLGCRITMAQSNPNPSKLEDEEAKRAPVVYGLETQNHILKEKITGRLLPASKHKYRGGERRNGGSQLRWLYENTAIGGQGQGCRVNGCEKEDASHLEWHEDFFVPRLCSRDTGEAQKIRGETKSP